MSTSPQRSRVPIELGSPESEDPNMSAENWEELNETIAAEAENFRTTGKLSPPRSRKDEETVDEPTSKEETVEAPDASSATEKASFYLPNLRNVFDILGELGEEPQNRNGLHLLFLVSSKRDPRIVWTMETELERRIHARQRAIDEQSSTNRNTLQVLLREQQRGKKSEHQQFMEHYEKSKKQALYEKNRDDAVIHDLDERNERQRKREEQKEKDTRALIEERKAKAQEARRKRQEEREKKLEELKAVDEETADTLWAVYRVKEKWEKAKEEAEQTGDPNKLDDY